MKMTYQETYEAEQRKAALREFKKENKEYEKNLYKDEKWVFKAGAATSTALSLLFALIVVSSVGMIFARMIGYAHHEPMQETYHVQNR